MLGLRPSCLLVAGRWKLLWTRYDDREVVRLYDRTSDPEEGSDQAARYPARTRRMLRTLQREMEIAESRPDTSSVEAEIDEATRRQLEAMGYVD